MATRTEVADVRMFNVGHRRRDMPSVLRWMTVPNDSVVNADFPPVLFVEPGAATIDLLMPADSIDIQGLRFTIVNTSLTTQTIVLKTSADAALFTGVTITAGQGVTVIHGGSTGAHGWRRAEGL